MSDAEARQRQTRYGPNALPGRGTRSPWRILREQLTATMVVVLLVASLASALLGDLADTSAILAIVVLNAALGFLQEYRAERALAALTRLAVPTVSVLRDGTLAMISARDLVPGDVVLLAAGERIPADGRVLEAVQLRVEEATLTGESLPVSKQVAPLRTTDLPLGDRTPMLYSGTAVVHGRGKMVVTATGMHTELGAIADLLQRVEHGPTPLQRHLQQLGKTLAAIALALVLVFLVLGLSRGEPWQVMLLTAISLAVAAVPEGLPAVVTIALALGAQRMLARHALIRRLTAVETLGAVTVICSDKTGTLTENQMTVAALAVADAAWDSSTDAPLALPPAPTMALLLAGAALCSDVRRDGEGWRGDPTEVALVVAADAAGLAKAALDAAFPRIDELPFDSERKRMTTRHACAAWPPQLPWPLAPLWDTLIGVGHAPTLAITKGAVDGVLDRSSGLWDGAAIVPLDAAHRAALLRRTDAWAADGLRVLGLAVRPLGADDALAERDLVFVGVIGMRDPCGPQHQTRYDAATKLVFAR